VPEKRLFSPFRFVSSDQAKNKIVFCRNRVFAERRDTDGAVRLQKNVLQEIEYFPSRRILRFTCKVGQLDVAQDDFARIESYTQGNLSLVCNHFVITIRGDNAEIELEEIRLLVARCLVSGQEKQEKEKEKEKEAKRDKNVNDILGYYYILGVETTATQESIKKAYRKRCLDIHPDVNKDQNAHVDFVRLQEAYQTLSNTGSRSIYDAQCITVPSANRVGETVNDEDKITFDPIRCSVCNCVTAQPRYVVFWETFSLFSTIRSPIQGIMCRDCAGNAALQATRKSLIFGWWGIWGIILTPVSVIGNIAGGSKPPDNNGRLLLHQAWYFANSNRLDLAYFLAKDAKLYLMMTSGQDQQSLVSICNSIIDSCKPFAAGKEIIRLWDKRLPQTGNQWKAVAICIISWIVGVNFLSWQFEESSRKTREGAPSYSYVKQTAKKTKIQQQSSPKDIPTIKPPIPPTFLPLDTGYLPGGETFERGGHSELTIKNNSDANFHIKLYVRFSGQWNLAREAYLKAGEEFVMSSLPPGEYEVRKMDVQAKNASKSQIFTLEELKDSQGIRYSTMSLSFNVIRGNSKSIDITAREF